MACDTSDSQQPRVVRCPTCGHSTSASGARECCPSCVNHEIAALRTRAEAAEAERDRARVEQTVLRAECARAEAEVERLRKELARATALINIDSARMVEQADRLNKIIDAADALRDAYSDTRGGVLVDLMRVAGACRVYDTVRGVR